MEVGVGHVSYDGDIEGARLGGGDTGGAPVTAIRFDCPIWLSAWGVDAFGTSVQEVSVSFGAVNARCGAITLRRELAELSDRVETSLAGGLARTVETPGVPSGTCDDAPEA